MKKNLFYLWSFFLSFSCLNASEIFTKEDIALIIQEGGRYAKRYEKWCLAKEQNYDESDAAGECDETPAIYDTIWPFFCLNHLVHNPEECSSWQMDGQNNPKLEFELKGNALAFVDLELFQRIGDRWRLIPIVGEKCDYGSCTICNDPIIRSYIDDNNYYWYQIGYRCSCFKKGEWDWIDTFDCEHHEYCKYYRSFKKKTNWNFCEKPSFFPGYFNWSYRTYFPFFEQFLSYVEKNPSCSCYWPHCDTSADFISLTALVGLEWIVRFTDIEEEIKKSKTPFSPYLRFSYLDEFVRGLIIHAYFYSQYRRIFNDLDQYCRNNLACETYQKIHLKLASIEYEILPLFQRLYSECLEQHPHPKIYYERGMTYFRQGAFLESLDDIRQFIAYAEENDYQELLTSDLYLQEGKLLNETLSYDEAIISLTKAIAKDPSNKEAYFERAIARFETGSFSSAVADYKISEIKPTFISKKDPLHYLDFSEGIAKGVLKGGLDSSIEFVPSLFSSVWGLGKGLWCFASHPIGVSKEFVEACQACLAFFQDKSMIELISNFVPEIQECIEKWNQLTDNEKGYYIGYVIGRYGVDIFAWGGCAKAIQVFQSMKRANTVLTLETALSSKNLKELTIQSEKYFKSREAFKKKCKLHKGQQEKHISGANNFDPSRNKSELLISMEELEELTYPHIGEGIPCRCTFGEAGYQEVVDYGKNIGVYVVEKTGERFPTAIGIIHYDKHGNYHVVPINPTSPRALKIKD